MNKPIKKIVESIKQGRFTDRHQDLRYHGEEVYRLAKTVFLEKKCHETMYPNIKIDPKACCRCGECASVCPVCHLEQNSDGAIRTNDKSPCIHCFNCVVACKIHAISLCGELDKARAFFNQLVAKGMETPGTDVYPRNL